MIEQINQGVHEQVEIFNVISFEYVLVSNKHRNELDDRKTENVCQEIIYMMAIGKSYGFGNLQRRGVCME